MKNSIGRQLADNAPAPNAAAKSPTVPLVDKTPISPAPGDKIRAFGDYEIIELIGKGGMGKVYKARQPLLNRIVALKILSPKLTEDTTYVARFRREAALAANLNHPNIVTVHAAGESNGVHYFIMEWVEGESLQKRLDRGGRMQPSEAIAIILEVAQALDYAWSAAQVIHRDIKPDNIFLSLDGKVKLGDLGLAKTIGSDTAAVTQTGYMMGTPHYISPEQAQGKKDVDFRTDIYSLGCTLYHMLTGGRPYSGDSGMEIMMKHVKEPPPDILEVLPDCSPCIAALVVRMMAKDPAMRHQSYADLIAELTAAHEKILARSMAAAAPPSGTITFLFTDIEGSSQMWEQHRAAMPIALEQHNRILHRSVEAYGGIVFKTVGDAFCMAFASAPNALAAAVAAQRALAAESWGETGPLRVRMGLHTGVAEERGGDYFGPALNRVARVMAAGHGGQILLSNATEQLVRDHLPEGASLSDMGERSLKNLLRTEHIFQLNIPDLLNEFPTLRAAVTPSPNRRRRRMMISTGVGAAVLVLVGALLWKNAGGLLRPTGESSGPQVMPIQPPAPVSQLPTIPPSLPASDVRKLADSGEPPEFAAAAASVPRPVPGKPGEMEVVAQGLARGDIANAREQALTDALRESVRKGAGVNLISTTQVKNSALEYDRVFASCFGYVRNYSVLNSGLGKDGLYRVVVRAQVGSGQPDMKDTLALRMLLSLKQSPRTLLEVDEVIEGVPAGAHFAKPWFEQAAREMNIELVDVAQLSSQNDRLAARDQLSGDGQTAAWRRAGIAQKADFIIQVKVRGNHLGKESFYGGLPVQKFSVAVDLRAVWTDTGVVLVSLPMPSQELTSGLEDPAAAGRDIVHRVLSGSLGDRYPGAWALFRKIFAHWTAELDLGAIIRLEIAKITDAEFDRIQRALKETAEITSVWPREFDSKALSFVDVESRLEAAALKAVVLKTLGEGFVFDHGTRHYLQFARAATGSNISTGSGRNAPESKLAQPSNEPKVTLAAPVWVWLLVGAGGAGIIAGVLTLRKKR